MLDSKDNVELRTRLAKLKMQDGDVDETNEEADADDEVIFFTALLSIYIFTYIPQQARAANLLNRRCVHNAPARRCKKCNGSDICEHRVTRNWCVVCKGPLLIRLQIKNQLALVSGTELFRPFLGGHRSKTSALFKNLQNPVDLCARSFDQPWSLEP
jgi:hypothetical protein